jgi:hypothetical protein
MESVSGAGKRRVDAQRRRCDSRRHRESEVPLQGHPWVALIVRARAARQFRPC